MRIAGLVILEISLAVASFGQAKPSAPTAAPAAPRTVSATSTPSAPSASLSWTASTQGCSTGCTYNVYRGLTSGSETLLTTGLTNTNYTDNNVVRGTSYCWQVTGVNNIGESGKSNEVCAQIPAPPSAPGNLTVTTSKLERFLDKFNDKMEQILNMEI